MNIAQNALDEDIFSKYDQFCRKYGMDSATPKSSEAFRMFLKYGIELPDEAVTRTMHQLKEVYRFSNWTY